MLRRRLLSAVSVGVVSSNPAVTVFHLRATRKISELRRENKSQDVYRVYIKKEV